MATKVEVECPECDYEIEVPSGSDVGDEISCEGCGENFAVRSNNPIELELIDEDLDEEDEDE